MNILFHLEKFNKNTPSIDNVDLIGGYVISSLGYISLLLCFDIIIYLIFHVDHYEILSYVTFVLFFSSLV
jgi:hypothetical protein